MIWHYTDRDSAGEAIVAGELRAQPVTIRTALIGGELVELAATVWFTVAETPAATVLSKLKLAGWPLQRPGMVWRFGVDAGTAPDTLPEWAAARGYPPEAFQWMLFTAQLAGEEWTCWRLSSVNVPRAAWLAVEWLDGQRWRPLIEWVG